MITTVPYTRTERCAEKVPYRKRQHAERVYTYIRKARHYKGFYKTMLSKSGMLHVYRCNVCAQFHLGRWPAWAGV
jgi:hypothetical protein